MSDCLSQALSIWWENVELVNRSDDHLYFLVHNDTVKIGRTKNPEKRISQLSTSLYAKHTMIVSYCMGFMEKELHKLFKDYAYRGEWFELNNDIMEFILKATNGVPCEVFRSK